MSGVPGPDGNGLAVEPDPAAGRRSFLRRAGGAMLGAAFAAPVVGSAVARAAGTQPAYTDAPNTFTADQTIDARLGVGVTPLVPLHVSRQNAGTAVELDGATMALVARQTTDWGGQTYDLIDLFHRSCGDAVFVVHQGGRPPGFTGQTGGIGGLNVLVPYYLDDTTTGRNGSTVNSKTGMRGVKLQLQPNNDDVVAVDVNHWTNAYAVYMGIQPSPSGEPTGKGGGILMDDYSVSSSLKVGKWTVPGPGEGVLTLSNQLPTPVLALRVSSSGKGAPVQIATDGTTTLGLGAGAKPFAVRLQAESRSSGVARNLALSNASGATGSGTQIEFDDASAQYALIASTFDSSSGRRNASLRFSVRASDAMTELMRLDGTGVGFYGAAPAAQPTVGGSRSGNSALASLLSALATLGLVTDGTSL